MLRPIGGRSGEALIGGMKLRGRCALRDVKETLRSRVKAFRRIEGVALAKSRGTKIPFRLAGQRQVVVVVGLCARGAERKRLAE